MAETIRILTVSETKCEHCDGKVIEYHRTKTGDLEGLTHSIPYCSYFLLNGAKISAGKVIHYESD